jgi:hypothetical protein
LRVVCATLFRRPEKTRQLLDALARCFGIQDTLLLLSCDFSEPYRDACDEVISLAESFDACETRVWVHKPKLGIDINKLFVVPWALTLAEFAIVLEDDTHPSPDALRYFDYCAERYRDDPRVVTVTGYNRVRTPAAQIDPYRLEMRLGWFVPWGWGIWRDRWERLFWGGAAQYLRDTRDNANGLFDYWMTERLKEIPGAGMVYPMLSRIQLDGWEDAEHPHPKWYHDSEEANPAKAQTLTKAAFTRARTPPTRRSSSAPGAAPSKSRAHSPRRCAVAWSSQFRRTPPGLRYPPMCSQPMKCAPTGNAIR